MPIDGETEEIKRKCEGTDAQKEYGKKLVEHVEEIEQEAQEKYNCNPFRGKGQNCPVRYMIPSSLR